MNSTTEQFALHSLKRALLEYSLKNKIEYLVQKFAIEKFSFDQYNIGSIRFELYNLYIKVKHKRIDLFQPLIDFLIEFNASFPETIEEKLYFRVLFSLQALFIYNSLMNDDLKTTSKLIKEYFPKDTTLTTSSNQNTEQIRSTREVQILKLRSEWNELLLNKSKRIQFFETRFKDLYDERFFGTLLNKTNLIIDAVNDRLPLTQLEEVQFNITLLNMNTIEISDEDEIRIDFFIDNLNLHKIFIESNPEGVKPTNYCTKYIKKIYKNLETWQIQLNDTASQELIESQENTQPSQTQTKKGKSIVHEFLYMDSIQSSLDTFQLGDEVPIEETEMDYQTSPDQRPRALVEAIAKKTPVISVRILNCNLTNDLTRTSNMTADLTKVSDLTKSMASFRSAPESFEPFGDSEIVLTGNKLRVKAYNNNNNNNNNNSGGNRKDIDLLTDDERD